MNILVCDDDHAIVDAIEIYLSQEGYRVLISERMIILPSRSIRWN